MSSQILYWDTGKSSFVVKDIAILRSNYRVNDFTLTPRKNFLMVYEFVRQFFVSLIYVFKCKLVVCQFAGYHSYIPFLIFRAFGKKCLLIAGGTDCVSFPSISYGNFNKKYLKWFTKKTYNLATAISPVDETLIRYYYTYQDNDFPEQGYRYHVKNIKAFDRVIYNGYDSKKFCIKSANRPANSFITVASDLSTRFGAKLKGIDLILEVAGELPDCTFTIIGGKRLSNVYIPDNVLLVNNVSNDQLIDFYNANRYYLQLSMSEGFPNALCEAMLCGCVPIVTNVGAMPKITAGVGYILPKKNPELLKAIIEEALKLPNNQDLMMRSRNAIKDRFILEKRKVELISLLESLILETNKP